MQNVIHYDLGVLHAKASDRTKMQSTSALEYGDEPVLSGDRLFHKVLRAVMPVPVLSNKANTAKQESKGVGSHREQPPCPQCRIQPIH